MPPTDEMTIPKDRDYVLRPQTPDEQQLREDFQDIPEYRIQMTLTDEQITRLTDQFFAEFDALVNERKDLKLDDKWKEKDNQYDGTLAPNDRLLFNLNVHQSKVKGQAIVRAMAKAYLSSGQIADISPRPGEAQSKTGYTDCERQTEFIDYAMDEEVKPENDLRKIWTEAYKKFVGIGRLEWSFRREKRKRFESYEGKNNITPVGQGVVLQNEGLQRFLQTYPDAAESYKSLVARLLQEKTVNIVVEYKDTVNNNARLKHVKLENFYVRNGCDYWEGLKTEHCIAEREEYTYFELVKKEKEGEFQNIDQLFSDTTKADTNESKPYKDIVAKSYKVIRGTYYFKLKETDDEEVKLVCWFGEEKKCFLGAILYPWYAIDIDYIPFYLRLNDYGFFGNCMSVMDDLKDSHIAQNALLSLYLHGAYARTIMTPIVKEGSLIEEMFLEKDWVEGMPLPVDEMSQDITKELGFVQWPQMNGGEMMQAIGFAQRMDSNVTGINDAAATGANDPTDPSAPAHKTIALMQASGINIEDYIECSLPSFNIFVTNVLQMYYQMSAEDRKYRLRTKAKSVTGDDPFKTITREQMIAKTNVQSRAAGFVFEKAQERNDNALAMATIKADPYARRIPMVQYKALQLVLGALGPRWKNFADNDLPSPENLDKELKTVALQAVHQLLDQANQQTQVTGVAPEVTADQLGGAVGEAQAGAYDPELAAAAQKAQPQ